MKTKKYLIKNFIPIAKEEAKGFSDVIECLESIEHYLNIQMDAEVKVNFAKVNEVIDELMEKNLNKERRQIRPDNWREFVGYEKALKELKTILSKISA